MSRGEAEVKSKVGDRVGPKEWSVWTSERQICGSAFVPITPADFVARIARWHWSSLLLRLAQFAVAEMRTRSETLHGALCTALIQDTGQSGDAIAKWAENELRKLNKGMPVAQPVLHDEVIYFMAAAALRYGADGDGPLPPAGDLVRLVLSANDLLESDAGPDGESTSESLLRLVATLGRSRRLNVRRDMVHAVTRTALLFAQRPTDVQSQVWGDMQRRAYDGKTFSEHFRHVLLPLILTAESWGHQRDGTLVNSVIDPATWYSQTALDKKPAIDFIKSLTISREDAVRQMPVDADHLPLRPAVLFRHPFIRLGDNASLCLSPRLLYEQLHLGTWARYRSAFDKSADWLPQFGHIFEAWIRKVTSAASAEAPLNAPIHRQVQMSETIGGLDEIEDVVFSDQQAAVLVSVKGALLPDRVAHAGTIADSAEWYERFFFEPRGIGKRGHPGAIRKLQAKVDEIRAGKWATMSRDLEIVPVVCSFEPFGDNPALYTWLETRCRALQLLQDRCWPICLMDVDDYEYYMAMCARGHNPVQILRNKPVTTWRKRNVDALLFDLAGRPDRLRLKMIEDEFDALNARTQAELFPRSS